MIKTRHFQPDEFKCPCCKVEKMNQTFINRLERARALDTIPYRINSGFRCETFQARLLGRGYQTASGVSPHEKGLAVDIACTNENRERILECLREVGFNRFGYSQYFIHVDSDNDRKNNYSWVYK